MWDSLTPGCTQRLSCCLPALPDQLFINSIAAILQTSQCLFKHLLYIYLYIYRCIYTASHLLLLLYPLWPADKQLTSHTRCLICNFHMLEMTLVSNTVHARIRSSAHPAAFNLTSTFFTPSGSTN